MRILVTSGSKHGGTKGIAEMIATALRDAQVEVELRDAREVESCAGFDAVIVGGALYANRWHRDARRFVARHLRGRGAVPVAFTFTAIVAALDLAVAAALIQRSFAMFESIAGTWLPLALIFLVTWATGAIMATLPWPKRAPSMTPSTPGAAHS